jgi:hypothetical protein
LNLLTRLALLSFSLGIPAVARQDATYDLLWHPHAEDTMTYKLKVDIDSNPEKFTFLQNLKIRVAKIKPNGDYDVETSTKGGHVIHGTKDDPINDDSKPVIDTYNSHGQKIATSEDNDPSEEANPGFNTLDSVTDQLAPKDPVTIGGTWSAIIKANSKQKREAARVNYTLASKMKEGTYQVFRIEFKYRETEKDNPVTAEGYVLLRQQDFSLVRFEGTIKGAHFSDDPDFPHGDATLSIIRD